MSKIKPTPVPAAETTTPFNGSSHNTVYYCVDCGHGKGHNGICGTCSLDKQDGLPYCETCLLHQKRLDFSFLDPRAFIRFWLLVAIRLVILAVNLPVVIIRIIYTIGQWIYEKPISTDHFLLYTVWRLPDTPKVKDETHIDGEERFIVAAATLLLSLAILSLFFYLNILTTPYILYHVFTHFVVPIFHVGGIVIAVITALALLS